MDDQDVSLQDHAYSHQVLAGLRSLRDERLLCDYTLVVDDSVFPVHKALLAAACEYFRAVFRSGMREARQGRLDLKGVPVTGLSIVLDFIYTGELHLSPDVVLDVLATSSHIQLTPVIAQCSQYLTKNINMDNIKDMQHVADIYHLTDLKQATHKFTVENFPRFARTDYYKQLPLSEICKLLKDNSLKCHSEYTLFKLVMGWIQYSQPNRESLASNLLKNIRLALLTEEELKHMLTIPLIKKNTYCVSQVEKALYFVKHPCEQIFHQSASFELRSEPHIVTFGCNDVSTHRCILYNGEWYALDGVMGQPRPFINASAVVVNNFLFVCGGQNRVVLNSCFCFNPYAMKWVCLRTMACPRRNFALAAQGGNLYAMGGITRRNVVMNSVEVFCIKKNTWRQASSMSSHAADQAATACQEKIYVAAGVDENCLHLKEFRMYDPDTDTWHAKCDLMEIKFRPAMFSMEKFIYLLDLYRTEGSCVHLEQYDVLTNQWTNVPLTGLQFSRPFSAAMIGDWIYFVGRNDVDDGTSKKYNVHTCEYQYTPAYPCEVDAPLCVTLSLLPRVLQKTMLASFKDT